MKLINTESFDFEKRKGESIWCVELVTNNENETALDTYECENEKEAITECEELNKHNQDKKFKYIVVRYLVEKDGFCSI